MVSLYIANVFRDTERTKMPRKNKMFLFLLAVYILIGAQQGHTIFGQEHKLPKEIEVREYFCLYSYSAHGINMHELHNPDNNPILNACLTGVTYKELEALGVENLSAHLEKLQTGKILSKVKDRYYLAFPTILGEKRAEFQKLVTQTALKLLPTTQKMIQEIMPHIKNRREMLYHVLWSIVMDGPTAWDTALAELKVRTKGGDTKIENTAWVIYPKHPYHCGTNGYGGSSSQVFYVAITWDQDASAPNRIHRIISKYENQLIQSYRTGQPIESTEGRKPLAQYGLLDDKGVAKVYVTDINSDAAYTYYKLGYEFGNEVMAHLDVEKVAKILGVSPGQALVITYHELCYEILKQLASKGILDVSIKSESQMYRLISFITKSEIRDAFLQSPVSPEEAEAINRFNKIKTKILIGESYCNLSSPVDAFLTLIAAHCLKDVSTYNKVETKSGPDSFEFSSDKIDYYKSIRIWRVPMVAEKPMQGSVHPIYVMQESDKKYSDIELFIYQGKSWKKLGNIGMPGIDWRKWVDLFMRQSGLLGEPNSVN